MHIRKTIVVFTLIAIITTSVISVFAAPKNLHALNYNNVSMQNTTTEQAVSSNHCNHYSIQNSTVRSPKMHNSSNINFNTPPLALQPSTRLGDTFESLPTREQAYLIGQTALDTVRNCIKFSWNYGPEMACVSFYVARAALSLSHEYLATPFWHHVGSPICHSGYNYVLKPLGKATKDYALLPIKDAGIDYAHYMWAGASNYTKKKAKDSIAFIGSGVAKSSLNLYYGAIYSGRKTISFAWNYITRPISKASYDYLFIPTGNAATNYTIQLHNFMTPSLAGGAIYAKRRMHNIIRNTTYNSFHTGQKVYNFIHDNIYKQLAAIQSRHLDIDKTRINAEAIYANNKTGTMSTAKTYTTFCPRHKLTNLFIDTPIVNHATTYYTNQVGSFITRSNITNNSFYNRSEISYVTSNKDVTYKYYSNKKKASSLACRNLFHPLIVPSISNIKEAKNIKLRLIRATVVNVLKTFVFY